MGLSASPATPLKNRRRITILKESFQTRYVIMTAGFVAIFTLLIFMDYFFFVRSVVADNPTRSDLIAILDKQGYVFAFRFVLYLFCVGTFLYVILHRLAGPVIQIQRTVQALTAGDLSCRVQLRRKDELRDLESDVNALATSLQNSLEADRKTVSRLTESVQHLKSLPGLSPGAQKHLETLRDGLDQLLRHSRV